MDEPLGTLDAEFRELMCLELKKLHIDIGATTVYVTHDQLEAMSLADRIAVMDGGEILQADEPNIIYNKPKTKFVASFIGSPGMNFIDIEQGISNEQSTIGIEGISFNIPKQFEISKGNKNFFGIRPENLSLADEGGLKGSVFGVEYLGSRKIITVKTNVGELKVKTDISTNVKLNENVQIKPSNDNIIIFDGETDKSLNSEFMQ
jgi:multiple sugar transport system ATP-binding protein